MQSKQYSVKVYETKVEDEAKFMAFFDANHTLFKDHLILIEGELTPAIETYLKVKKMTYMNNVTLPKGRTRKALEEELRTEKV